MLEELAMCRVCGYDMCHKHLYQCGKCNARVCKSDRHFDRCPNWKEETRKRMDIIGNKYMVNIILDYLKFD